MAGDSLHRLRLLVAGRDNWRNGRTGLRVTDETIDEALSAMDGKAAIYPGEGYPTLATTDR